MEDVVTANATVGSPPQEQTGDQTAAVTAQVPASQPLRPGDENIQVEAHIPGSASETAPPSVINPLSPKDAKEKSPLDNAGGEGGEGGESGSEAGGERVGNNRRRRKHSSASEDQEEKEDEEADEGEEADGSEVEHDKEGSHLSDDEGREQGEEEGGEEGGSPLPKKDPTYVPTKGGFYLHDDRFEDTEQEPAAPKPPEAPKPRTDVNDRWTHDLYVESEQCPRERGKDSRDYDRRPARSRKLNSFLSDVDQKRISQRRGEGSWKSRGGRGYGRSDGKRGGPGRPQHWDNMEKEGVPPKGEREERKEPLATPTESLTAPQDGSRKGVEEKSSSVGAKDAVEEWPDLQPNEGDGKGDQMGALQQGGGGGGGETGKDGPLGKSARANGTGSKEGPSKEGHESSKTGRQDDEMPSRLAGTRVGGHDDSAHREPNAGDSKRGAHWGNRGGGQRGNRHPNDGDQRQKWSKGRPEGQDRGGGGEKGDVRSGRKHDSLQGQGEREAYRREGHHPSEASQGKPRGGRGGRVTEGYKRNERAPASDQSNSHSVTTPPSSRVGEGPIPSLGRGERGAPREASDSGKPKSLFHTGETEGTKLTKVYSLSAEEGVARLSVMTSSNKGMGRGRGWKERLESPQKEEGGGGAPTLPTETVAASATREGGAQKTNIRVIESLEQRLSVGKTVTSLAARAIPPPVEPSSLVTSPPKDESEACREKGVVKSRGPGEEDTVEGAQVTKPKRYSSRRQQKAGENGDLLVGSEDVIPLGYGPHGNPMIPPMSWLNPNYYQPYLAHQMQQMKLMMSQPPMMMPQPPGMMSQPSGMMPQPPGVMEMGYPMPYMYWQPPPHSAAHLDSYPTMIPPPASVPIHGMEGEVGGPSYNPLPMGGGGYYMPPQVALDQQRASHSPSLPATAKPRSQAIPIVSPTPPQQQQDPPGEL